MGKNNRLGGRIRYNILTTIVYIIGIILLIQLFNLQIIHGAEYRETSNSRLTRESIIKAARGSIKDRTGVELVSTDTGYSVEIYSTKVSDSELNNSIKKFIEILESNKDEFVDNLPIEVDPYKFKQEDVESQKNWKIQYEMDENYTAEQAFNALKEKYEITESDVKMARKIMAVRYEISRNGYSTTKSVTIAKDISNTSAVQIREQNSMLSGMYVVTEPVVSYKSGSLASHVLGYVGAINAEEYEARKDRYRNDDVIGKSGIQYVFEDYLKGTDGIRQVDMTVDGAVTSEYTAEEAIAGSDVILTIDANLQKVAEDALEKNIKDIAKGKYGEKTDSEAGAVVVMNVDSGEVLAMASYPDYNPGKYSEEYSEDSTGKYLNRAISSAYAPGSTFKMVVASAALTTGEISPTSLVNDNGIYPYGDRQACWYYRSYGRGHGYLNVTQALKYSCNYFFYDMGYRIGIDKIAEYAKKYGLGQKTGIELEGEATGSVASKEYAESLGQGWYISDTLSAAIGQSYNNFTPIQMARYVSMIANDGKSIDTTIVKSIIKPDGTEISKDEINEYVKNKLGLGDTNLEDVKISKEDSQAIKKGMRGVTSEAGGTAAAYFSDLDIDIAGKTGSAQTGIDGEAHGWFVGFAPYDDPEIAVVVFVEKAGSGGYTSDVAKKIIKEYFGMNSEKVTEDKSAESSTQSVR
jgi:penicillin-binding protein 2